MVLRLRRFFDVRSGEGLRVLLSFLYVTVVVAAFLLARPIRNSLFLSEYDAYALVYAYAAVPFALWLFVPVYSRTAARVGSRVVTAATLVFFSANALIFWYWFSFHPESADEWWLPGIFYVWVNCFGVIAPVQAWSFANSLFDTRQAKRLFGLIGAGASLGAMTAGLLAYFLVGPVGGTVNMLLVLALLILSAAGIVVVATVRIRRPGPARRGRPAGNPFRDAMRQIAATPYLRLMAALVFLVAIATQWTNFQLSLVARERFGQDGDALTAFFGTFNFVLGALSFLLQLLITGPSLRRFGVALTILVLPLALGLGSTLILLVPSFWAVLFTNASDQAVRFSLDKATYELLYLPLPAAGRTPIKNTIDIVVNRFADAAGAVLLGLATQGFLMLPGLGLGLRGTAAINLVVIGAWTAVAWRLRVEYVRTIQASIHRHRLDSERMSSDILERSAAEALGARLAAADPEEVRYALTLLEAQRIKELHPALRGLLSHAAPDIRKRALAVLAASGDRSIAARAAELLRDPDPGVRTEALLYMTREMGVDPLRQLEELGDFEDFSIRAGMASFFASPGRTQNLDAAGAILNAMAGSPGPEGAHDRAQAARILALVPDAFLDLLIPLVNDPDPDVARQAIESARVVVRPELVAALCDALARPDLTDHAVDALAAYGNSVVPGIESRLNEPATALDVKRELPAVLVRIGTPEAHQILIHGLLQADVTLRHRIISSLNKLHDLHRDVRVDAQLVELVLAAEIGGHYRSYQVLGPLRAHLKDDDPIVEALRHSMEQELERIFRLMALLIPGEALHDAYVGVRSSNTIVRANALEFLDNVLKPDLRQVLVPLLDSQVSIEERIALADRLVGAPLQTAEQAVGTLLASEDGWLRSCAVYAVGALQLHQLEGNLRKFEMSSDPVLREEVQAALRNLAGDTDLAQQRPAPAEIGMGVG